MPPTPTAYTLDLPKAFRQFFLVAGLVAIGLAFWSVIGDIRASSGGVVQQNYVRPLLLSILGGALLSASRYKNS
ncbi:hypothetical protein BH24DEI2_BH24DEI2_27980 [soil metagenome]